MNSVKVNYEKGQKVCFSSLKVGQPYLNGDGKLRFKVPAHTKVGSTAVCEVFDPQQGKTFIVDNSDMVTPVDIEINVRAPGVNI